MEEVHALVVHADERVVVIDKPPGVSLATRRSEPGAAVARLLAAVPDADRKCHGLDAGLLLLVHRLDVGTSGLVVLARDAAAHRALVAAFATRQVSKTYLALVWGRPRRREGVYDAPLGPDRRDRRRMCVEAGGRRAVSRYRVVGTARHASLVELHPETGRTHQLRVHLAHAGHPIVGDDLYGGPRHRGVRDPDVRRALQPDHPFLHAWRLRIPATAYRVALDLEVSPPADFLAAIEALGIVLDDAAAHRSDRP